MDCYFSTLMTVMKGATMIRNFQYYLHDFEFICLYRLYNNNSKMKNEELKTTRKKREKKKKKDPCGKNKTTLSAIRPSSFVLAPILN